MRGACVSCGIESPPWVRVCPYCGEAVRTPAAFRIARTLAALLPLPSLAAIHAPLAPPAGRVGSALLALGALALMLPADSSDLIFSSRGEWRRWQLGSLAGRIAAGALMAIVMAAWRAEPEPLAFWAFLRGASACAALASWPLLWRLGAGSFAGLALVFAAFVSVGC